MFDFYIATLRNLMKQKKTFQRFCKQSLISSRKKMISAVSNFIFVGRFIRLGLSSAETLFLGLLWYNKAVALLLRFDVAALII